MTQTGLFAGRGSDTPTGSSGPEFSFFVSTTWMLRRAYMDDFKIRALCPGKAFRPRLTWNRKDADGDYLQWVLKYEKGPDGKMAAFHVQGPDGQPLTRKRTNGGSYAHDYDPKWPDFPSHDFPSMGDAYFVTGDDGTRWKVGSRGNGHEVLRMEILCNRVLWPDEKTEILGWLYGDRKLRLGPRADPYVGETPAGEAEAVERLISFVDGHYCDRIMHGPAPTEAEVLASGLPDRTIENLLLNLRNYRPPDR